MEKRTRNLILFVVSWLLVAVPLVALAFQYNQLNENYIQALGIAETICRNNNKTISIVPHPDVVKRLCSNSGYSDGWVTQTCGQNQVQCCNTVGINISRCCCVSVITGRPEAFCNLFGAATTG